MGVINHNAVLATTWDEKRVEKIKEWISKLHIDLIKLFLIGPVTINSYTTIVLVPDGSKEGWEQSDRGNELRESFIKELDEYWEWIEIGYGEFGPSVVKSNTKDCYG